mmetsp:Transcript_17491/g.29674  ORF Transcript_17491/g.29674 Transcript_17491/m.29674 type:complete len:99 (+) Transcript_17491:88-384(+)
MTDIVGAEKEETALNKEEGEGISPSVRSLVKGILQNEQHGLTSKQVEEARAEYGFNEVAVKEPPLLLQILSRYLGIVPLFMTTTAVLSAAIFSNCANG